MPSYRFGGLGAVLLVSKGFKEFDRDFILSLGLQTIPLIITPFTTSSRFIDKVSDFSPARTVLGFL